MGHGVDLRQGRGAGLTAAIRTKAGLMDVSGLKKLYLGGPVRIGHPELRHHARCDQDQTRDSCRYACMLNDAGYFIEDQVLYRTGPNSWMVVHGSGAGHETAAPYVSGAHLRNDLRRRSARSVVAWDRSRSTFLSKHAAGGARASSTFYHMLPAMLFGRPVTLIAHRLHGRARLARFLLQGVEDAGPPLGYHPDR